MIETLFHSASAVIVVLLLAGTGYFLGRIGYLKSEHKPMITKLCINVSLPCMCISNLLSQFTRQSLQAAAPLLIVPLLVSLGCVLLCFIALKFLHLPHNRKGVFVVMAAFNNSTFIGLPMCVELFGEAAIPYVTCYYLVNTTLFQTLGIALLSWSGRPAEAKPGLGSLLLGLLKKPPMLAIFLALFLIWFEISLPPILESYVGYMGDMVAPLGLLYTGFVIYEHGLRNLRMERGMAPMLLFRFIISPAICLALCPLFGIAGLARGVYLVQAALPTMTQSVVLAGLLGADEDYAAQGAALSTLLCFAVIPLVMLLI